MKSIITVICLVSAAPVLAQEAVTTLGAISLEDLMQVEVISAAKKPQRLANVAAAVHVITAEDIRLSGAHSLPEVLSLAPGIDATRVSGNRWAVSIRGFASRLANKLLVLVDGRNAYTPAFSGVIWEDLQFPLENIERIEVLRGPAATVWGTNGVNGVINVITKSAAGTQGIQAIAGAGTVEGAYGRVRMGGQNADASLFYRVYGSLQDANEQKALTGGDGQDSYRHQSAGFRLDGYRIDGSRWDISGDFYVVRSDIGSTLSLPGVAITNPNNEKHHGLTLRARYEVPLAGSGSLQIQGAYSHSNTRIANVAADQRDTLDFDFQHRLKLENRHDIVWGSSYRVTDDTMPLMQLVQMDDVSRRTVSYGIFGQDEIMLAEDWRLTLGMRFDHNEYTGWEAQPDARLSWNIAPNHSVWGSLSKVSRAPSRGEHGLSSGFIEGSTNLGFPFGIVPNFLHVYNPANTSERLKAAQIGLRSQWAQNFSTDAVVYTHRYDRLPIYGTPSVVPNLLGYIDVHVPVVNVGDVTLNGAELSADWRPVPNWRLQLAYTFQDVQHADTAVIDTATIPRHIGSVRASWTPNAQIDVDLWLRHMGSRPGVASAPYLARRAFDGVDMRIAWRPQKNLELALIGQNLNDGACDAYTGIVAAEAMPKMLPTCMPRSLTAQLRLDF